MTDLSGRLAATFKVPGTPASFRSELALPAEDGLQERWYGARIATDQITDNAGYIVLQWHAVMGNDKVNRNFPNLALQQKNNKWVVARAWGTPSDIKRSSTELPGVVEPGKLVNWVFHVKWATDSSGVIEIWKDGSLAYRTTGQNAYVLSTNRTPYLKTGIYRPSRKNTTTSEAPIVVRVSDVRIGRADAKYADVSAVVSGTVQKWDSGTSMANLIFPADFAADAGSSNIGFVAAPQVKTSDAPKTLTYVPGIETSSKFTVDLTNRTTNASKALTMEGWRHTGCSLVVMSATIGCGRAKHNYLELIYEPRNNKQVPLGLYEGTLQLEGRDWKDRSYQRVIDANFSILVTKVSGELREGKPLRFPNWLNIDKSGTGFVVPAQFNATGPTALSNVNVTDDTRISAIGTHDKSGAPYPIVIRARRDAGTCGKFSMNSGSRCPTNQNILELEYRADDNPGLPSGTFTGGFLVNALGFVERFAPSPMGVGFVVRK